MEWNRLTLRQPIGSRLIEEQEPDGSIILVNRTAAAE